jgi:hypothetical protein
VTAPALVVGSGRLALEGDEDGIGQTKRPKDIGNACVYLLDD